MYPDSFYDSTKKTLDPVMTTLVPHIDQGVTLDLIKNLFQLIHENKINYCHWKSSQHLGASMVADTDLDILFDLEQKEKLEVLLSQLSFKKFTPPKMRQYDHIEDYIGYDECSGKIVHLHAHFKLTLGETYLKSYQPSIEYKILGCRVYDEEFEIYRIHPAFELVLLFFRQALKIRNRDKIKSFFRKEMEVAPNIMKEYEWLKKRCTENEVQAIVNSMFDEDQRSVNELVTGQFNGITLLKLADLLKEKYKEQRLYSPMGALITRWSRELYLKSFQWYARMVNRPMVLKRINPRGGLSIGIIGADGSGKTTVVNNLYGTYKHKLDVYSIYFGNGAGKKSWHRQILVRAKKIADYKKTIKITSSKPGFYRCLEALSVAREKASNLRKMLSARNKGMLVICDRFPQNQVMGYNDGPVLHSLLVSKNPVFRQMAKYEAKLYRRFEQTVPDIIFKLIADPKILEARKPGQTRYDLLKLKVEGIRKLIFPARSVVITLDAGEPIDQVLLTIKKRIWETYT